MRRARARTATLFALAALTVGGCGEVAGRGSGRLELETPKWWFQHLPVPIEARKEGLLRGVPATYTVAVGSNVAGRWEAARDSTSIRIPAAFFRLGTNEISVKTGSERSVAKIQIVSFAWLATTVILVAAILAYLARGLVRRRRRARAGSAVAA